MASEEFNHWINFLETRKEEIANLAQTKKEIQSIDWEHKHNDASLEFKHNIADHDMARLKEFFDRFKSHSTHRIASHRLTQFHGEFTKAHKVGLPVHPKNMAQMIHPFYGYLAAFPDIELSWQELVQVYKNQIASSYEKSFGNDLLGEEICCLSYWLLADPQKKGWLSCQEAVPLFLALKFNNMLRDHYHKPEEFLTIAKLREEFDFNLR